MWNKEIIASTHCSRRYYNGLSILGGYNGEVERAVSQFGNMVLRGSHNQINAQLTKKKTLA
jgi:hypothetical protein